MGYTRKLPKGIKHSIWSVLDAAIYPVAYMATVPIMMRSMGLVTFGFWIVLSSVMTVLQLCNFNLGITATRNVSYELANNNTERVKDIINGILQITGVLLLVVSLIGIFLSYAAVNYGWWGLKGMPLMATSTCIILAAILAGLKYFDQVFQSIIKAKEHFKVAAILNMINRFGLLSINLYMAMNKYPIAEMLWANIVFLILYLAVQYICVVRILPFYKMGKVKDLSQFKKLLNFSMWPWLQSLIVILTFQTDRFWVSTYAGLGVVSGYGLVSTMFNHIHMIFIAMAAWMLPRIAAMTSRGEDPSKLYSIVRGCLFGIIVCSLLFFYYISPTVFRIWVGQETYKHMYVYIRAFVGFEIVFAHTIMPFFYLNAAGKEKLATKVTLLYCGTCYVLMISGLLLFHSPEAMVTGMTLAMCITMPIINCIVQKSMHNTYSITNALLEMIPMYAAIILIYTQMTWGQLVLPVFIIYFLWKFYLRNVFNNRLWNRVAST